ncbi:MAG TPA: hypothetical protein VH062_01755 [Polyangiaceae bacterium]|jgi:hypothetical protein|nr:hypothetical protein [Polyangiaceae bacterium]
MDSEIPLGKKQIIDGRLRVYYYGYWIRAYEAPADSLLAKKQLIHALTRRLFNHVEHGLNIPGERLEEARHAFETETRHEHRRVKGAMLAGALFNRATDIFTKLVEIQSLGVEIHADNALLRECGEYFQEALELGKMVLHRSGDEGIDELWGEPLKAFMFPIDSFYESRYVKISQTMREIDQICDTLRETFHGVAAFAGVEEPIIELAAAAKLKSEILRTDTDIFDVWAAFVVVTEALAAFEPHLASDATADDRQRAADGTRLLASGSALISDIARARVPMPKSAREFIEQCKTYQATGRRPSKALSVA